MLVNVTAGWRMMEMRGTWILLHPYLSSSNIFQEKVDNLYSSQLRNLATVSKTTCVALKGRGGNVFWILSWTVLLTSADWGLRGNWKLTSSIKIGAEPTTSCCEADHVSNLQRCSADSGFCLIVAEEFMRLVMFAHNAAGNDVLSYFHIGHSNKS